RQPPRAGASCAPLGGRAGPRGGMSRSEHGQNAGRAPRSLASYARKEPAMDREIGFTVVATSLGALLVAASERGVCRVAFGEDEQELTALLRSELPFAHLVRGGGSVRRWAAALARAVEGDGAHLELPLDVAGSRFQQRVWQALRAIPRGEVRSYGAVARA